MTDYTNGRLTTLWRFFIASSTTVLTLGGTWMAVSIVDLKRDNAMLIERIDGMRRLGISPEADNRLRPLEIKTLEIDYRLRRVEDRLDGHRR